MARKDRLGLHTTGEQIRAMSLAEKVYRKTLKHIETARNRGTIDGAVNFAFGYLQAIADLAQAEGAEEVWRGAMGYVNEVGQAYRDSTGG